MQPVYALTCAVTATVLVLLTLACASTPASTNSTQTTSAASQLQGTLTPAEKRVSEKILECAGPGAIKDIRAEFAANPLRAEEIYVGQRLCLKGEIVSFNKRGSDRNTGQRADSWVVVSVGEGAQLSLRYSDWERWSTANLPDGEWRETRDPWQEWMLGGSVGDTVEAECTVRRFTSRGNHPDKSPGIPLFIDCLRVVDGALWNAPAPTPTPVPPTPTPQPCIAVGTDDSEHWWLNIDCPNGEVVASMPIYSVEMERYRPLLDGDSNIIAFYFRAEDESPTDDPFEHHSSWKRWTQRLEGAEGISLVWEAPPDIAAMIISEWRRGTSVELIMRIGDCCNAEMFFDIARPPGPLREWQATDNVPVPSPTSVPVSTPVLQPTHTPTPIATPSPVRTLSPTSTSTPAPPSIQTPLTAAFIDVPPSHNGRDAIQFQLLFTEPVSTSYKTLRDTAIRVENGDVRESKRVDGRNDLWMVTVEPDGPEDMVIALKAPADCGDIAAVCTEAGKALSNSPTVLVSYEK